MQSPESINKSSYNKGWNEALEAVLLYSERCSGCEKCTKDDAITTGNECVALRDCTCHYHVLLDSSDIKYLLKD